MLAESPYSVGGVNAPLPAMVGHDDRDTTAGDSTAARDEPRPAPPTANPFRPVVQDPDPETWREQAVCAQVDPELFFPDKGGSSRTAKAICRSCPVRVQCLAAALTRGERFGIWGGLSERDRRLLTPAQRRAHIAAAARRQKESA